MRTGVGTLDVYTFKAGVLAVAAHDLHLRLEEISVVLDGESVRADFPLERLRLLGPVEGGVTRTGRYSPGQVAEVESAMRGEILHVAQHPVARFSGRASERDAGWEIDGELELAGARAPLAMTLGRAGDRWTGKAELQPSRWGIREYRAMLGTIRLQDRVRIEIAVRER
jgi:hypothetical protein